MTQRAFDALVWSFIVIAGIVGGFVAFGLLESQAQIESNTQMVGGAVAGMLIIWGSLGSLYLQIRKSGGELEDLREENRALQQKLIRGAPHPDDYTVEVDDRQRLVLARPDSWRPRGGVLFDFQEPSKTLAPGDYLPARFSVSFEPIEDESGTDAETYYRNYLASFQANEFITNLNAEYVFLGAERDIRSFRITFDVAGQAIKSPHPILPDRDEFYWQDLTPEQYHEIVEGGEPIPQANGAQPKGTEPSPATPEGEAEEAVPPPATPEGEAEEAAPPPATQEGEAEEAEASEVTPPTPVSSDIPMEPGATGQLESVESAFTWGRRMIVVCFHLPLRRIFFFDFQQDAPGFVSSSETFNQILNSVRFLS